MQKLLVTIYLEPVFRKVLALLLHVEEGAGITDRRLDLGERCQPGGLFGA